ncbi:prepilin-type N-terminal cleavage/methylation domain-containing protein [Tuanshanicoccus lijuaniae]|uniref:competence type IV pilus major pilin ComGC n=1 Tax=Aerococcaceae bacterium zg-1292 TaxID=2774330 RepID=UPI001935D5D5|nr:prepilin-type N-terminal cleavage/methylation domain-containing protein [Aerococcaceae bacterium zg-1292]MBF6626028.1 prepilin-type N-terminal cleavage/methylation domain-containing protein [Aerococcaceae bacterium zg-BR9]MBF6978884.1 prepilin-type N-terminal cleavage/methylation domain-containing protein [Aerococcaceae bacterium zg-BR22]MBS4455318.1 prepilin-type N-terminal cleavage/methylation domain-containing protein [Aerococcaceae bacterium zg-A91]MBS4457872.1 prepilin-type N-terminal c
MREKLVKKLLCIKNKKGFTLIEMLIVLIIVALLMAIIIPNVAGQRDRIEKQARANIAEIIETQVNTYNLVESSKDASLAKLVSEGYITQKQSDEAERLLKLTSDAVIQLPINVE